MSCYDNDRVEVNLLMNTFGDEGVEGLAETRSALCEGAKKKSNDKIATHCQEKPAGGTNHYDTLWFGF